jgi:2-polyprenyl-6-methoxyphenol hydroxylase-like FAD-dependent oxidoreductase
MNPQVLVVGAGPVGLTMASELARYGVRVRIIDKAPQRTDKSKALAVWSRTLEMLDRAGCAHDFIAAGNKVDAANIVAANKLIARVSLAEAKSPYPYALMLPQSDTERLLEEHLNRLNVHIERQVELTQFSDGENGVETTLRSASGGEERLTVDWLIGCDGAHSTVRHGLAMSFSGSTLDTDWMLADLHLKAFPFPASELATYWHENGVLVALPISPGRYRVIADLGASTGTLPASPTLAEVQAVLDQRGPGGLVAHDPVWLSAFRINERKVADYRSGRVFLAGDAAHVHSPAGGQGMNTGMQDAFNLAWKLALVCRGIGAEGLLLDSYSVERSAVGDMVLSDSGRLTALATLRNHAAQVVRNLVGHVLLGLAPVREAMVNNMSEIAISYKHSALNGHAAHGVKGPLPGERVMPVAGQAPFGSGDTPRFTLLASSNDGGKGLAREFDDLVDPTIRPPLSDGGIWLVRPDGYVGCVAAADNLEAIAGYLQAIRSTVSVSR